MQTLRDRGAVVNDPSRWTRMAVQPYPGGMTPPSRHEREEAQRRDALRKLEELRHDGDGVFGSAYAAHVLHLIPTWRDAVGELARVVRPSGTVLIDIGMPPSNENQPIEAVTDRFTMEAGLNRRHPGLEEDGAPALT